MMDSRITQLHDSILDKTQKFKIGDDHAKTFNQLLEKKNLCFEDIRSTFEDVTKAKQGKDENNSVFLDYDKKPIFRETSSMAAYDIVLQLDKAMILSHLAKTKMLDSKESAKDYAEKIKAFIQKKETTYKESLQKIISDKTQERIDNHNKKIDAVNEKIKRLNEEQLPEAKERPIADEKSLDSNLGSELILLIEKENRFAAYQKLNVEIQTLETEPFQLDDLKVEIKSPSIEINEAFPELDAEIISTQQNITQQQEQEKAIAEYEVLIDQIKKELDQYHEHYIIKPGASVLGGLSAVASAVSSAGSMVLERTHAASKMTFSLLGQVSSLMAQPTIKESKLSVEEQPKTPSEYHQLLIQHYHSLTHASKELKSIQEKSFASEHAKLAALKQKQLEVNQQLQNAFNVSFSEENRENIKREALKTEQNRLRQLAKPIDKIHPLPPSVSEEEWNQVLEKYPLDNLTKTFTTIEKTLLNFGPNSQEYRVIHDKYTPVLKRLREKITSLEASQQSIRQEKAEPKAKSIPREEPRIANNVVVLQEEKKASEPTPPRVSAEVHHPHTSSGWVNLAKVAFVSFLIVGSLLTGGALGGLFGGSMLLYLGMSALGVDVIGMISYGIKKLLNKCCSSKKEKDQHQSRESQRKDRMSNQKNEGTRTADIRTGLTIPPSAPGSYLEAAPPSLEDSCSFGSAFLDSDSSNSLTVDSDLESRRSRSFSRIS